jgi:hypothetical protein
VLLIAFVTPCITRGIGHFCRSLTVTREAGITHHPLGMPVGILYSASLSGATGLSSRRKVFPVIPGFQPGLLQEATII